mgnify:CR=1 FL=1
MTLKFEVEASSPRINEVDPGRSVYWYLIQRRRNTEEPRREMALDVRVVCRAWKRGNVFPRINMLMRGRVEYIEVRTRPRDQGETERWAVAFSRDMVRDRRRSQEKWRTSPRSASTDNLRVSRECDRSAVTLDRDSGVGVAKRRYVWARRGQRASHLIMEVFTIS